MHVSPTISLSKQLVEITNACSGF